MAFAHELREVYGDRWLRIHSLPESKRYPEDEMEYRELLRRHNLVATETLGEGIECVLLHTRFRFIECDGAPPSPLEFDALPGVDFRLVPELGVAEDAADPGDRRVAEVFAAAVRWEPGAFDRLIREVADDTIQWFIFLAWETGRGYAPYDGGADLFLASGSERDALRSRYSEWLSRHPGGL